MMSRINDVGTVLGGMKAFSCRAMEMNVKRRLYERVVVAPGVEIWSMAVHKVELPYKGGSEAEAQGGEINL